MAQDSKDPIDDGLEEPQRDVSEEATMETSVPTDGSLAADDGEAAAEAKARAESDTPDANLDSEAVDEAIESVFEAGMEEPAESAMIPTLEILDDDEEDLDDAPSPEPIAGRGNSRNRVQRHSSFESAGIG